MIQLSDTCPNMRLLNICLMLCLTYLQMLSSIVEGYLNVSLLNVYVNSSSPKFINVIKSELTPDALYFHELDILQELHQVYVSFCSVGW